MSLWKKKRPRSNTWTVDGESDSSIHNPNFDQDPEENIANINNAENDGGLRNPNFDNSEISENENRTNGAENPNVEYDNQLEPNPHDASEIHEIKTWKGEFRKAVTVFTLGGQQIAIL